MNRLRAWLRRLCECEASLEQELLARVLEVLGKHAFETHRRRREENRQLYLQLSHHARAGKYASILPALTQQRTDEQQLVEEHLNDLRDMAWHLLNALAQITQTEAQDDTTLRQHLQQLSQQAQRPDQLDVQTLRLALRSMTEVIARREQRHQQTLRELQGQIHHLMRELEQARRESTTDALTGVYNRRAFETCLQSTVAVHRLFHYPATMLLIDIDHFKQVNDTYGHATGDAVLKAVAEQIVRVCKRRSDFVARYGGEEFAVILRETTLRDAHKLAVQIAQQVQQHPFTLPTGERIQITVSIGISELRPDEEAEQWFRRTDALLYQAKQAGRNRIEAA